MVNSYFKSLHGIITSLQVLLGFVAIFACSFIWNDSNVYIQLGFKGYGWQTLVLIVLLVTWFIAFAILISQLTERSLLENLGKFKQLILYSTCCATLIVAAVLESWYCKLAVGNKVLYPRFIIVTILAWILVVSYVFMIIGTLFS